MARTLGRLTALQVTRKAKAGMYADGGGLYLQVKHSDAKSWIFRFAADGRQREMGLGSLSAVTLADARGLAAACRAQRAAGIDPIAARDATRSANALESAKATTFKEAATRYIASHEAGWKNPKHRQQWKSTLETYAYPIIGPLSVQAIDAELVLKVIEPIWTTKPETAGRVRGRIECILDWAKVRKLRDGDNPARWRGHLEHMLPLQSKVRKVVHHPAMPYAALPAFLESLRPLPGIGPRALEWTILTASRTENTIGATWPEIDTANKVWVIAGEKMKNGKEHRVPLTERMLAILAEMKEAKVSEFVFPGWKKETGLSNGTMLQLMEKTGHGHYTVHGFRSTFNDWASEQTTHPNHVVEMALAHAIGDKVQEAYRRGNLFEHRVKLMAAWDTYCTTPEAKQGGNVVAMRG